MDSETEAFLAEVVPAQQAAEKAIHEGDVEPRLALWSHTAPVTLLRSRSDRLWLVGVGADVPYRRILLLGLPGV